MELVIKKDTLTLIVVRVVRTHQVHLVLVEHLEQYLRNVVVVQHQELVILVHRIPIVTVVRVDIAPLVQV